MFEFGAYCAQRTVSAQEVAAGSIAVYIEGTFINPCSCVNRLLPSPSEPLPGPWLVGNGDPDLLEIYHARALEKIVRAHLQRLEDRPHATGEQGCAAGEVSVFYESLLMSVEHLLGALGDSPQR